MLKDIAISRSGLKLLGIILRRFIFVAVAKVTRVFIIISVIGLFVFFLIYLFYYDDINKAGVVKFIYSFDKDDKRFYFNLIVIIVTIFLGFWMNRKQVKDEHFLQYKLDSSKDICDILAKTSEYLIQIKERTESLINLNALLRKVKYQMDIIEKNKIIIASYYDLIISSKNFRTVLSRSVDIHSNLMLQVGLDYFLLEVSFTYDCIVKQFNAIMIPYGKDNYKLIEYFLKEFNEINHKVIINNCISLLGTIGIVTSIVNSELQSDILRGVPRAKLALLRSETMSGRLLSFRKYMNNRKIFYKKLQKESIVPNFWEHYAELDLKQVSKDDNDHE